MTPDPTALARAVTARERGFRKVTSVTVGLAAFSVVAAAGVAVAARSATAASRSPGSTADTTTDPGGTQALPNDQGSQGFQGQGGQGLQGGGGPPSATSGGS